MNQALRDKIVKPFLTGKDYGDVIGFNDMPLTVVKQLIQLKLLDMGEWNNCAGVKKMFLPFLKRNPEFRAHGYVVSPERQDSRITIEGVEKDSQLSKDELIDFATTFQAADDLRVTEDYAYCWYD
jgi:hypothetical protein